MIKVLKGLLGMNSRAQPASNLKPIANLKRSKCLGDFRAVEIAPSAACCAAAKQASGRPYLLGKAPRLPLLGCTMPTTCSCMYRKNADRRDSDRRLFGATEKNRWFAGRESRNGEGRRLTKQ